MLRRTLGPALAAGLALAGVPRAAPAQEAFPARPIVLVVPGAAGGPTDAFARLLAQSFSRTLGTTVVENTPGAAGQIGAYRVARAAPDGHLLLVGNAGLTTAPAFFRNLRVDLEFDLAPVGLVNVAPFVLVTRPGLPARDAASLAALLRARGDAVSMGHGGIGGIAHLCGIVIAQRLGAGFNFIAYPGAAPALNDVIAGHVDTMCVQSVDAVPQAAAGRVRPIAATGPARLPQLPEVPTLAEAGIQDAEIVMWHGLLAPRGTPPAVIGALNRALGTALADETVLRRFADAGAEPPAAERRTPEAMGAALRAELARWETVARAAGIEKQ
jgi:tripartite-type tricarboxylate transporter receptor subunit TctC